MSRLSYFGGGTGSTGSGNFSINYPVGITAGQLAVLALGAESGNQFDGPSDYQKLDPSGSSATYAKILDGTEGASVGITGGDSGEKSCGVLMIFDGYDVDTMVIEYAELTDASEICPNTTAPTSGSFWTAATDGSLMLEAFSESIVPVLSSTWTLEAEIYTSGGGAAGSGDYYISSTSNMTQVGIPNEGAGGGDSAGAGGGYNLPSGSGRFNWVGGLASFFFVGTVGVYSMDVTGRGSSFSFS